jgi:hypothetical protein
VSTTPYSIEAPLEQVVPELPPAVEPEPAPEDVVPEPELPLADVVWEVVDPALPDVVPEALAVGEPLPCEVVAS